MSLHAECLYQATFGYTFISQVSWWQKEKSTDANTNILFPMRLFSLLIVNYYHFSFRYQCFELGFWDSLLWYRSDVGAAKIPFPSLKDKDHKLAWDKITKLIMRLIGQETAGIPRATRVLSYHWLSMHMFFPQTFCYFNFGSDDLSKS